MQKVFIGILLILLDFHLEFSTGHLGLIPDFIGYFVLLRGLRQLTEDGPSFKRAIPAAIGIGIYSFFLWVADLFGFAATQSPMVPSSTWKVSVESWLVWSGVRWAQRSMEPLLSASTSASAFS